MINWKLGTFSLIFKLRLKNPIRNANVSAKTMEHFVTKYVKKTHPSKNKIVRFESIWAGRGEYFHIKKYHNMALIIICETI